MKEIIFTLLVSVVFFGCAKENSDEFYPYNNNLTSDTVWTIETASTAQVHLIGELISFPAKVDSFDAVAGASLQFNDGLHVTIPPSSCTGLSGTIATGKLRIHIIHLKTKGDFVRFGKPTTSHHRLLETGGSFYISVTKEGQELALLPGKYITLKYKNANPNSNMKVFYGEQTATALPLTSSIGFTWVPAQDNSNVRTFESRDSSGNLIRGYEMMSQRFRWVNCDYFIDTTQPRTRINTVLPPHFTNKNTTVFAVFKDQNIVVQLSPEFLSRSFFAVNIPVGKNITLLSLSKTDNELYLGRIETTTSAGLTLQLKPELKTKQQVIQFLESL